MSLHLSYFSVFVLHFYGFYNNFFFTRVLGNGLPMKTFRHCAWVPSPVLRVFIRGYLLQKGLFVVRLFGVNILYKGNASTNYFRVVRAFSSYSLTRPNFFMNTVGAKRVFMNKGGGVLYRVLNIGKVTRQFRAGKGCWILVYVCRVFRVFFPYGTVDSLLFPLRLLWHKA